jgi:hypothetical protein
VDELRVWQNLSRRERDGGTLVPKGGQRDEGGEEARIVMRTHGQDPSKCGKAGGDVQESIFFFFVHASRRH